MKKILVIHGLGMNMRGKTQTATFGRLTLSDYDDAINKYASQLDLSVEIFHSNIDGEVINRIYQAFDENISAILINPAGYTLSHPGLVTAIAQSGLPTFEVHISNPALRGTVSEIAKVAKGTITGFGVLGYFLAMQGILAEISDDA